MATCPPSGSPSSGRCWGRWQGAFIQSFFLCFTDFGIPASVGGKYDVVATVLTTRCWAACPISNRGAVVAMVMLLPSIVSILLLRFLERYNIRYDRISDADLRPNRGRDTAWGLSGTVLSVGMLSIFAVILVVPLVQNWPYQTQFTLATSRRFLQTASCRRCTSTPGHGAVYGVLWDAAGLRRGADHCPGTPAQVAQAERGFHRAGDQYHPRHGAGPGLSVHLHGNPLQNTFPLMILCNVVHYFSTPYLMMKNSLSKMNAGWETTAMLMGDSWLQTILRVVTPNAPSSLIEVFSYYFINSMVTISTP